ncbi:MAG TPA: hypothetical protein VFO60_01470 [Candidatus Dormibacteraeota bacterium]|nr:hypothetical protein [Candidatus Dormibacteraeota bacterium]
MSATRHAARLDDLRAACDRYLEAADRELYLHHSGQKPALDLTAVHGEHGAPFTTAAFAAVLEARGDADDVEERRRLTTLAMMVGELCMERELAPVADEIGTAQAESTIEVDGRTIGYYGATVAIQNEADRARRGRIDAARLEAVERLNPLRATLLRRHHDLVRELGYPGYVDFYSDLKGIDLRGLGATMREFLDRTAGLWREAVTPWFEEFAGVPLDEGRRHDLSAMLRLRDRDSWFGRDDMVGALRTTLLGLGVALDDQPNVHLDLEERPAKSPRAFCASVRVPDEVYLVLRPTGGYQDWRALFHEAGHAEHFAHVDAARPVEDRRLGDNSVTEAFAFTFEHLLVDETWIRERTGATGDGVDAFLRRVHTIYLYFIRRYAAKIVYELDLHGAGPDALDGSAVRYRELLDEALVVGHDGRTFLEDLDAGFYCAQYLRAWMLEAQLKERWRTLHGERWWRPGAAGAELRSLWSLGQALPADALAAELGMGGLGIEALERRIRDGLAA